MTLIAITDEHMDDDKSPDTVWDAQHYINTRLDTQQRYHSQKSSTSKTRFYLLRRAEIILAAFIPVLAIFPPDIPYMQYVIGGVGAVLTVVAGFLALGKYEEDAVVHRIVSEKLKSIKVLFKTKSGDFSISANDQGSDVEQQRLDKLVQNVELILAEDNTRWSGSRLDRKE